MSEKPLPNYAFMAACCRHRAPGAEQSVKDGLEQAAIVLSFLDEHKALMRALSYFVVKHPEIETVLAELPAGTRLEFPTFLPQKKDAA